MSEWEEKLNTLLSDPDAMAQVMNIAQNLSQQMGQSGGSAPPPPPAGGAAGPAPSAPPPPPPPPTELQAHRRGGRDGSDGGGVGQEVGFRLRGPKTVMPVANIRQCME